MAIRKNKKFNFGGTPSELSHPNLAGKLVRCFSVTRAFLLHSLAARLPEIPQRFSSSSLPPEFAAGRCAAVFIPRA